MAEAGAGEEWTTIGKKAGKKKSKQEEEWQEVPSTKKDRRKKDSSTAPPPAPAEQAGGRGGGRGRGRGDGSDRGRGRGGERGGRGGTLPRKDSRPGGGGRGGTLPRGGGRGGGHTPSPGPRAGTPGSSSSLSTPPVRATPPPPSGPALQGAWAAKATPSAGPEATPPPAVDTPPPRKASWANIAKEEGGAEGKVVQLPVGKEEEPAPSPAKEEETAAKEVEVAAGPDKEEPVPSLAMGEDIVQEVEAAASPVEMNITTASPKSTEEKEELTEDVKAVEEIVPSEPPEEAAVAQTEPASDVLTEDKNVHDEEVVVPAAESNKLEEVANDAAKLEVAVVEAKKEPTENLVMSKEENQTVIKEVVVADTNGNFPMDANDNLTCPATTETPVEAEVEPVEAVEEVEKVVAVEEVEARDELTEINSNVIKPAETETEAPLTNGVTEPLGPAPLPYTPDQWHPTNNPTGKKQYERDFLLQLQKNPLSLQKPAAMPTNMEVILSEAAVLRPVASAPNLGDMSYITGRPSAQRGAPGRRDSRNQPKSSAAARLGSGVKVITLPNREEVKLNEAENAWKPAVKVGTEVVPELDGEEQLAKSVRSILNKLCPQKFDTLVEQFGKLPIDTKEKLTRATDLVFEKALDEPGFSVAYARMCKVLSMLKIADEEGKEINFRTQMITRCQKEFMRDYMADLDRGAYVASLAKATTEEEKKAITADFNFQETKLRRRSLGNIKFIGELYRIQMLNGRIMHEIIQKLLKEVDEESLECMCRLITTVGQILDQETQRVLSSAKVLPGYNSLDIYFTSIKSLIEKRVSTARIRFLMQDVLELRQAKWVARREEAGPKTIEQIHKDAAMDAMKKSLEASDPGPPPSRRSEDRGDRRRSQTARGPPKERQQPKENQDGWNNVPDRPARISQGKIDLSKLPGRGRVDASSLQLGPPGGMRPGGGASWGRGSQQGQKKTSVAAQPANRFALFGDDEDTAASTASTPAAQYHGRASEPAIRTYSGRGSAEARSREGSQGRDSREGSYVGRHSEGRRGVAAVPEAEAVSNLRGAADTAAEVLEQKTKAILEEYFGLGDMAEAYLCLTELYHPDTITSYVENMFNCVVERTSKDRGAAGRLLAHLMEKDSLSKSVFQAGLVGILEVAEDLAIDIPKFWQYLAELLAPALLAGVAPLALLAAALAGLPGHLAERCAARVLGAMVAADGPVAVRLWAESGLGLTDLGIGHPEQFCAEHGLTDLLPVSNGLLDPSMRDLASLLGTLAKAEEAAVNLSPVFEHITANFPDTADTVFLRNLVSTVLQACLLGLDTMVSLAPDRLTRLAPVLKPFLDAQKDREVQALYSLQALVHRLEHPNKLLHSIFDVLYEIELISEDAFMEWEESTEPGEQEGKGVALKSCTQFFEWLKTAEPEDDPEEPPKVGFSIGDGLAD